MNIKIKKRIFNPAYFDRLFAFEPFYELYYGGGSSGKSYFITQKILINTLKTKGYNTLVLRQTQRSNRDSTFQQFKQLINLWGISQYLRVNNSDLSITNIFNKNKIIFRGLDDAEKLKSVTFENGILTTVWCEEASEMREDDVNQLNVRLRGKSNIPKQLILSMNPIDKDHWIKARFVDRIDDSIFTLHTTYKQNNFLTDEDKQRLEDWKNIDKYYYDVYCLGKWGDLSSAKVFHNYVIEDIKYTPDQLENVSYGMDFGFNHASAIMGVGFKDNELYTFFEIYEKGKTNTELIEILDKSGFDKRQLITADSAEPDRIKQFRQAGYNVQASKKGKGSLQNGIDYLRSKRLHIDKKCVNLTKEVAGFKYRELKDGTIDDSFVEINDDAIAAIRYATEWIWSKGTIKASFNASALGL